jgi:nucleotide-binding universal stress UspA family protein
LPSTAPAGRVGGGVDAALNRSRSVPIAVATDFSTRSDRAIRRAELLAAAVGDDLLLINVIDDDQPPRMIQVEQDETEQLMEEMVATIKNVSGLGVTYAIRLGQTFEQLPLAAAEAGADLIVMGPHRSSVRDIFRGTTIERTMRNSPLPILVANALPSSNYQLVLATTTMEPWSAARIRDLKSAAWLRAADFVLLHIFQSLEETARAVALTSIEDAPARMNHERVEMQRRLVEFARDEKLSVKHSVARRASGPVATTLLEVARQERADLLAFWPREKGFIEFLMTGRVSSDLIHEAAIDLLILPGARSEAAPDALAAV